MAMHYCLACVYCQRHNDVNELAAGRKPAGGEQRKNRKAGTLNEVERRADVSGKNGCVVVPRTGSGKRVRVVLIDDDN